MWSGFINPKKRKVKKMSQKLQTPDKSFIGLNGEKVPMPGQLAKERTNALRILEEIDPEKQLPLEFRVLLRVASVEELTDGGIIKPIETLDKELFNKTKAEVVAVGAEAFTGTDGLHIANRPKPGDIVITAKYAGNVYRDKDFNMYRFCNDKDVVAIVTA